MKQLIPFTKMNGTGNDFIILDHRDRRFEDRILKKIAKSTCRRGLGLGADGLLLLEPSRTEVDFTMRIFNADGSEGEMCGNGARCMARYAYVKGIGKEHMIFDTLAGHVEAKVQGREVSIKLNDPSVIEMKKNIDLELPMVWTYIELGNPGVPHAVVSFKGLQDTPLGELQALGRRLRYHESFPKGANINFYEIFEDNSVLVRTYERGVEDITLACGTGSASVAIALALEGKMKGASVQILTMGGPLEINIGQMVPKVQNIYLTGETTFVAEGWICDEAVEEFEERRG
ncbi:diaminopimelate epimerase [Anaerosolibacter carboniphilus]|uniref:Diaminopimelate epimerase n=1 Tax=Anaerosolibacter carboniphilus TaxID=1417629 RepID=A0A841KT31_9FIRM|nr:diaminopimelate epimerase [Anaerosolibacter carboniphilus]MBB6214072.1 diaminopimelate epimerase [Anaerosolibacter carboniphilus]